MSRIDIMTRTKKKENEIIDKLLEVFFWALLILQGFYYVPESTEIWLMLFLIWLGITSVIILNYVIKKMSGYKIVKKGVAK